MLHVLETTRRLRFTRGGRLLPWLGPALRGLTSARLKDRVCAFTPQERPLYCRGCRHQGACPHAVTFEPDPPPGAHVLSGQEDAARPLVVDATFPAPSRALPGDECRVRVVFLGPAVTAVSAFWDALAEAGADPDGGFGPDHVTFEVLSGLEPDRHELLALPTALTTATVQPRLTVRLTAPLILRRSGPDGRHLVIRPAFADLFGACLRTLGPLLRLYGEPLPQEIFRPLKELAAEVPTVRAQFQVHRQFKWSNRTASGGDVTGVIGSAVFERVPTILVPWLSWGGRLHVGTHRVAGAGGWRVEHENAPVSEIRTGRIPCPVVPGTPARS